MNIAYLILAHTDLPQLRRLIKALNDGHASFLIHIDRKVDIQPFISEVGSEKNVRFIERRTRIRHAGFSIVRATLDLMEEAINVEGSHYLVLLSGLDYPIKDNQFIRGYFTRHQGREFIRYVNILEAPFLTPKIETMRFHDSPTVERANRVLHKAAWGVGLRKAGSPILKRKFVEGFVPYFGSQWWAITRACAKHVLRFVEENKALSDFFRFTYGPDEMFFHTIIMNSAFAARTNCVIENVRWPGVDYPVREAGDEIKYIDWNVEREWPAILDERDFEALARSERLFARKLTTDRSLKLIEQIDRNLLRS